MPIKTLKLKETDKPWITDYFKELILRRNTAFRSGDTDVYHNLRNKVNRERKILQNRFFAQRICRLKQANSKAWWRELKSLAGFSKSNDVCLTNLKVRVQLK